MSSTSLFERLPSLAVTVCGVAVSGATLFAVHYLGERDFNPMGWYAYGVVPFGAVLVGAATGFGYAYSAKLLQIKLERRYIGAMLLIGFLTYWTALFVTYADEIKIAGIDPDDYSFVDYLRDKCELMTIGQVNANAKGAPLGKLGYLFKALEMIGFVAGATIPSAIVSGVPYCGRCRKYLKPFAKGFRHSHDNWSDVRTQGSAEKMLIINAALNSLGPQSARELELVQSGSPDDWKAYVGKFEPKAILLRLARLEYVVDKCPTCLAHRVKITQVHCGTNGAPKKQVLHLVERFAPTDDELAPADSAST
jgi:hypothetical protein